MEGCWDAAVCGGEVIHQFVNLQGADTFTYVLGYVVQYGGIEVTRLADALNLLFGLDQAGGGYKFALFLPAEYNTVHFCRFHSCGNEPTRRFILLILATHTSLVI